MCILKVTGGEGVLSSARMQRCFMTFKAKAFIRYYFVKFIKPVQASILHYYTLVYINNWNAARFNKRYCEVH